MNVMCSILRGLTGLALERVFHVGASASKGCTAILISPDQESGV